MRARAVQAQPATYRSQEDSLSTPRPELKSKFPIVVGPYAPNIPDQVMILCRGMVALHISSLTFPSRA